MVGLKTHSSISKEGRRGGRVRDTTMVIRRVCAILVTYPGPDPGGPLTIDLKKSDEFYCGCSGEKICRLVGSRPCVVVNSVVRHCRQVGLVQRSGSHSQ